MCIWAIILILFLTMQLMISNYVPTIDYYQTSIDVRVQIQSQGPRNDGSIEHKQIGCLFGS